MTGHIPYLNTEYARNKDQECYDIEARQKEKRLDDGQQDGNEYKTKKQAALARTDKA